MSKQLQLQNIDGKKYLVYPFRSIREVDDIILQLLNEAEQEGFLESSIRKSQKVVAYNIDHLTSLADLPDRVLTREQFISVLQDLLDMLVYLEDSFIGPEYIAFDRDEVYVDPDTCKLYLAILPVQSPGASSSLQNCVLDLISKFTSGEGDPFSADAIMRTTSGMSKISDLQNLIRHLQEFADTQPEVSAAPAAEEAAEEIPPAEEAILEIPAAEEASAVEEPALEISAAEEGPAVEEVVPEIPAAEEAPAVEEPVLEIPAAEETPTVEEVVPEIPAAEEAPAVEEAALEIPAAEEAPAVKEVVPEIPAAEEVPAVEEAAPEIPAAEEVPAVEEAAPEIAPIEEKAAEADSSDAETKDLISEVIAEEKTSGEEAVPIFEKAIEIDIDQPAGVESAADNTLIFNKELKSELAAVFSAPEEAEKENEELKEIEKAMDEPEAEEITDEIPVSELEEQLAQKEVITVSGRKPAYLFRKKTSELIPLSGIPFLLGKIPTACDYLISDNPAVSRIHAVIRYSEEEAFYYIVDCGTTNNTYLNGKKIPKGKGVRLYDKDRLHLATEEFVFNHQN